MQLLKLESLTPLTGCTVTKLGTAQSVLHLELGSFSHCALLKYVPPGPITSTHLNPLLCSPDALY